MMNHDAKLLHAIAGRIAYESKGHRRMHAAKLRFQIERGVDLGEVRKNLLRLVKAPIGKRSRTTDDENQLRLF